MDYYKLRSRIFQDIKNHLRNNQDLIDKGMKPPPFSLFMSRLIGDYGATNKMVKNMIEDLIPGATIKDGEIVAKNEE